MYCIPLVIKPTSLSVVHFPDAHIQHFDNQEMCAGVKNVIVYEFID